MTLGSRAVPPRKWVGLALLVCCVACGQPAIKSPTATLIPTPTSLPSLRIPGALYIDAAQRLGPISPLVYGTNYGPWITVPFELLPQAEAARITYLRFPGGNWGDQNDLRGYQIDEFIALARRMGAEPSISVRLLGGTPEQAAELLRYTNQTNDYNVRYWSIGNEPSLYPDYDTEWYNAEWRTFAEAMLAVDPDILLIGPDIHQYTGDPAYNPHDAAGRDWLREFLLANGDLVDVVSIHRYPFPTRMVGPATTIEDLRANSREWDVIIPSFRALMGETTRRDLSIAVTEVNSHWTSATGGEATPDSFYNAIWWGDVLGRLIRQRVDIVAHFALQSSTGAGGWGLLARYEVRPTYYVYQMYKHFGNELVHASSDDTDVSIYAALRDDGALTFIVINLGPEEQTKPLLLDNIEITTPAEVWLFDADHQAEKIGEETIVSGEQVTLPAQSISLYILPQP